MNNLNEYKKRFYNLMESTLGDVKPLISEQPTPTTVTVDQNVSKSENPLAKEVESLKLLKQELENTKKQLESKKDLVGGTLLKRIGDYFRIRKLRKDNEKLSGQLESLERDIKRYKDGKIVGNENEGLITTLSLTIYYIGVFLGIYISDVIKEDIEITDVDFPFPDDPNELNKFHVEEIFKVANSADEATEMIEDHYPDYYFEEQKDTGYGKTMAFMSPEGEEIAGKYIIGCCGGRGDFENMDRFKRSDDAFYNPRKRY